MDAPMTSPYPRPPWPGPIETSFLGVPPARPSPKSDGGIAVGMRACSEVERGRTRTVELWEGCQTRKVGFERATDVSVRSLGGSDPESHPQSTTWMSELEVGWFRAPLSVVLLYARSLRLFPPPTQPRPVAQAVFGQ